MVPTETPFTRCCRNSVTGAACEGGCGERCCGGAVLLERLYRWRGWAAGEAGLLERPCCRRGYPSGEAMRRGAGRSADPPVNQKRLRIDRGRVLGLVLLDAQHH